MADRKEWDKKYRDSEKGKENKKKWNTWELNKNYYSCKPCLNCGRIRKIIARGLCDTCRKKKL